MHRVAEGDAGHHHEVTGLQIGDRDRPCASLASERGVGRAEDLIEPGAERGVGGGDRARPSSGASLPSFQ